MARLAVLDSRVFLQYMSAAANMLEKPETTLWEGLLDQWRQRVSAPDTYDLREERTYLSHRFFIV
jgi:hypothetical protein